jgi:hypothetical protein
MIRGKLSQLSKVLSAIRNCFEMANHADSRQKRKMNNEDLQAVLELVLDRQNMVMIDFRYHFCNGTLKETVREIMQGQKPSSELIIKNCILADKEIIHATESITVYFQR